jgi:hypothetical protein
MRLTPSFTLDYSTSYNMSSSDSEISLFVTPSNSLYIMASSISSQSTIASVSPSGALFPTFGDSGKTSSTNLNWYGSSSRGRHIGIQSNGKIIIVGDGIRRLIP